MRTFVADTFFAFASIGIAAGLVALSAPAAAADLDAGAPRQVAIQTADLNLSSPEGRTVAERRIRQAATRVCATGDDHAPIDGRCRAAAFGDASKALDAQIASN